MERLYRFLRATLAAVAVIAALGAIHLFAVRPWMLGWGSTPGERARPLVGDELVPHAAVVATRAVTVDAAPREVWPWLIQIGQERAGFYSYDWLENIITADIHNTEHLVGAWQARRAGDFVRGARRDFFGPTVGERVGWPVARVEPGRALVLAGWGAFVLEPAEDGRTRLIARSRSPGQGSMTRALVETWLVEPAHFVMERRMLLGIKERAEGVAPAPPWMLTVATMGWMAAAAGVMIALARRGRKPVLALVPVLALAALVWWKTADGVAALAAFTGFGLALAGLILLHRLRWLWIVGLGAYTFLVLAVARDAWITFGVGFLAAAAATLILFAQRRARARPRTWLRPIYP